jgi:hypothetical protein
MKCLVCATLAALGAGFASPPARADFLVPMDLAQTNHLKAYGLAYHVLVKGENVKWLLNYRGGSFLIPERPGFSMEAQARGVRLETVDGAEVATILQEINDSNAEVVLLEKEPAIAIYAPPNKQPWDDAVMLALEYAGIPYTSVYDREVLAGELERYDWLHLHHEDFTGQYGKFYAGYRTADWYIKEQILNEQIAESLGFTKVSEEKKAVARAIKEYVREGGFLFAMCSATDSFDIALAAEGIDIVPREYDHDGITPDCQKLLDFDKTLAFEGFTLVTNPLVYEFSDIDMTGAAAARGEGRDYFSLRVLGEIRSRAHDARAGPRAGHQGLHGADDVVQKELDQEEGAHPRRGERVGGGALHPRELRARDVHVSRRARSRGLPAPRRRSPDGPRALPELPWVSAHSQQHSLPRGEEEGAEDVNASRETRRE